MNGNCDSNKRTANFSSQEVCILLEIVRTYKHIIECKQSDKLLWNRKAQTWNKIADTFNARSGAVHRDANVLKKKYENMKKITKKKYADEKCALRGTGGGPSKPSLITPVDEELKELIGVQIDGFVSVYDCDDINIVQNSSDIAIAGCSYIEKDNCMSGSSDNAIAECSNTGKDSSLSGTPSNDWSKYVPAMLRQPMSKELRFVVDDDDDDDDDGNYLFPEPTVCVTTSPDVKKANQKNPTKKNTGKVKDSTGQLMTSEKWDRLAEAKLKLVHLQTTLLQKEHELKIKQMKEQHDLILESHALKMKLHEDEHNLVKEKLKLEIEILKKSL